MYECNLTMVVCGLIAVFVVMTMPSASLEVDEDMVRLWIRDEIGKNGNFGSGSTYVRWGRTDCPGNDSELVYKGYAGGSHYTYTGAAANYLCLTEEPIYGHVKSVIQAGAFVYGAEYKIDQVFDHNVPCAVCRTTRSSVLMIPGSNVCTVGWTLEYKGYLTAGNSNHAAASEFVCLDDDLVTIPGGYVKQDGKLFYFTEGMCGSLPCPPYTNGQKLTCAVCTK